MKNTSIILLAAFAILAMLTFTACPPAKPGGGTTDSTQTDSVPPVATHDYGKAVITLERTVCFGKCPAYTLKIDGRGKVDYNGLDFVAVTGAQSSQITPEAVKGLVDEFFKIDYFALQDSFDSPITDVPSYTTSLSIDGKTKTVFNRAGGPEALHALENKIDEVANSAQWVKAPEK
jgi:Domain of unknown function (DUF6438)